MFKPKKAFTLIELLVVIAIIGILATVSIIALSNARSKSRDAKRVGNMKQVQTALELFFNDNGRYPTEGEWAQGSLFSTTSDATTTYLQVIPTAPIPADGDCSENENALAYTQVESGASYSISFCIGNTTGSIIPGNKTLTPAGIIAVGGEQEEEEETPPAGFSCGSTLTDTRDSQTYSTVLIGTQCWMAENLNVGTRVAGSQNQGDYADGIEKYCYGDNEINPNLSNYTVGGCDTDGGLYQWHMAMGLPQGCDYDGQSPCIPSQPQQGICPAGWHLPSDSELPDNTSDWRALEQGLASDGSCDTTYTWGCSPAGTKIKTRYNNPSSNSNGCNPDNSDCGSSGFGALAVGYRDPSGVFAMRGDWEILWSSLYHPSIVTNSWARFISLWNPTIYRNTYDKTHGFPVRCVKD
ncbi:MAG: FISUMP domain-containing protein [Patescibacteria group bacterium]